MNFVKKIPNMINFRTDCRVDSRIDSKINSRIDNTSPCNSLELIKFETCYIKPNPPLFSRQQNLQWSRNMIHSHFTLCVRAQDYIKWLSQHPWYGLWMRVKGPHHYKVTALGSCVKWPWLICNSCKDNYQIGFVYIIQHLPPRTCDPTIIKL